MDPFSEGIKSERKSIDLVSKSQIVGALRSKIDEVTGVIPDLIRRLAIKVLDDIENCSNEQQLIDHIRNWAEVTKSQSNPEIQFFMNGMGSILIRVNLINDNVEHNDDREG